MEEEKAGEQLETGRSSRSGRRVARRLRGEECLRAGGGGCDAVIGFVLYLGSPRES
jgi:hypothetical protein